MKVYLIGLKVYSLFSDGTSQDVTYWNTGNVGWSFTNSTIWASPGECFQELENVRLKDPEAFMQERTISIPE